LRRKPQLARAVVAYGVNSGPDAATAALTGSAAVTAASLKP
jgi:hypothetical protein